MTTVGRWSPNKVRARVLDGTWAEPIVSGMVLLTPTSIAYTGTSASIGANGSVEFSAVTSLSLNGVFSADYDNYIINLGYVCTGGEQAFTLRLRASGVDDATSSSYTNQILYASNTTVSSARQSTVYARVNTSGYNDVGTSISLYGPHLTQATAGRFLHIDRYGNVPSLQDVAWTHNQSTSYDGVTLGVTGSIVMSGLVSVYGLVGA